MDFSHNAPKISNGKSKSAVQYILQNYENLGWCVSLRRNTPYKIEQG
ncbi:hypothetical protein NIES2107_62050 [Nostoc carneum NIES-2107]|nr:hypothetical protein NIES2107_62050 [Nostoc carneum NIES-2107]